ncbi:hypothetical protein AMJAP_1033 [Amphritea japonica ATCC BAA-1530]|uniref:SPOR domain-containing protein n=1 Tax=Amphritea japonica ATCC BAA-1530 TaxID=1278309 RepID=A0A7R6SRW7_9GAMM|nr:hypothetical protein AMJAP_1033 [Amphritea japonica ATCC BAA-1530]
MTSSAQDQHCRLLYQTKQFSAALTHCMPQAEQGDGEASFIISSIYVQGSADHPASLENALTWLIRSAEQGHGPGCYNLGVLYERGEVVARDDKVAFKWYLKGSEQGYVPSQLKTGVAYLKGVGTEQSLTQAQHWLGRAAVAGDQSAQVTLAAMLTSTEPQKAVELYHQAAAQHNSYAHYQLALIYSESGEMERQDLDKALLHASESMRLGHAPANALIESLNQQLALQQSTLSGSEKTDALPEPDKMTVAKPETAILAAREVETSPVTELKKSDLSPGASAIALSEEQAVLDDATASVINNGLRDYEWLMLQPSSRYVLQLIQLSTVSAVNRFMQANKLEGRVNYFKALTKAGRVYVVLYADSANSPAEARQLAKSQLPESIADQVWFRSYRSLQSAYRPAD